MRPQWLSRQAWPRSSRRLNVVLFPRLGVLELVRRLLVLVQADGREG